MIGSKQKEVYPALFEKSAGFTIVELIVAVFVFSSVSLIASGVFVSAVKFNRKALNIQRADENTRNILEMMAREIRVANTIDGSDTNCPASSVSSLSFTHPVNGKIRYFLSGTEIHREIDNKDSVVSSGNIRITELKFCLKGLGAGDQKQARVTVQMALESGQGNEMITSRAQTTLSQRRIIDD